MTPAPSYIYYADVERVIDGDTLVLAIDLGFRNTRHERVRLARVNAPEMSTPEGPVSQAWTADWTSRQPAGPKRFVIVSRKGVSTPTQDNYGRYICELYRSIDGANLSDDLLSTGHAGKYR